MAVDVSAVPTFKAGIPGFLFRSAHIGAVKNVSRDGQRFVVVMPRSACREALFTLEASGATPIRWRSAVQRGCSVIGRVFQATIKLRIDVQAR